MRKASVGGESTRNAHPFQYKEWIFAQNGRMHRNSLVAHLNKKFMKKLTSETDSEVFFYLIMQNFEETGDIYLSLENTLKIVKKYEYHGLNFILSNKDKTYVSRDVNPNDTELFGYYTLNYLVKDDQVIISSDPLSEDGWVPIKINQLITIDSNLEINKTEM